MITNFLLHFFQISAIRIYVHGLNDRFDSYVGNANGVKINVVPFPAKLSLGSQRINVKEREKLSLLSFNSKWPQRDCHCYDLKSRDNHPERVVNIKCFPNRGGKLLCVFCNRVYIRVYIYIIPMMRVKGSNRLPRVYLTRSAHKTTERKCASYYVISCAGGGLCLRRVTCYPVQWSAVCGRYRTLLTNKRDDIGCKVYPRLYRRIPHVSRVPGWITKCKTARRRPRYYTRRSNKKPRS